VLVWEIRVLGYSVCGGSHLSRNRRSGHVVGNSLLSVKLLGFLFVITMVDERTVKGGGERRGERRTGARGVLEETHSRRSEREGETLDTRSGQVRPCGAPMRRQKRPGQSSARAASRHLQPSNHRVPLHAGLANQSKVLEFAHSVCPITVGWLQAVQP
jgi:hypothetical protein